MIKRKTPYKSYRHLVFSWLRIIWLTAKTKRQREFTVEDILKWAKGMDLDIRDNSVSVAVHRLLRDGGYLIQLGDRKTYRLRADAPPIPGKVENGDIWYSVANMRGKND